MQIKLTYQTLSNIVNGTLHNTGLDNILQDLSYDTRTLQSGSAYIALEGKTHDGHKFLPSALEKGANLLIVSKEGAKKYANVLANAPYLEVDNTLIALQEIAKFHRLRYPIKIVGITGSNGKSTTKQMLNALLNSVGKTCATAGNFNNQIGVPLSLLGISKGDKYGVFELGASHIGDIAEIARLVMPDVAIITNIGPSHLEFFKTMENIYKTKTEIISYLSSLGCIVFNGDDAYLKNIRTDFKCKMISFGFGSENDIVIQDSPLFSFTYKGVLFKTILQLEKHNKLNAAGACGAALALGLFKEQVEQGISSFKQLPLRLEKIEKGNTTFILDCYNANPASMQVALEILSKYKSPKIAILGDMRELGETSAKYHKDLGLLLTKLEIDEIFLIGQEMQNAYKVFLENAPKNAIKIHYALDKNSFINELKELVKKEGTFLFKASNSLNFAELYKQITEVK